WGSAYEVAAYLGAGPQHAGLCPHGRGQAAGQAEPPPRPGKDLFPGGPAGGLPRRHRGHVALPPPDPPLVLPIRPARHPHRPAGPGPLAGPAAVRVSTSGGETVENTPLYDALRAFAAARPLRMHMPGHKGRPLPAPELAGLSTLDFTELPPTGDRYAGGDAIEAAEALWAKAFRMAHCLFLTGGATQGVQAALALACRPGDAVLLDRGSHRSAYNALALLDLRPVYLERPWLPQAGVTGPVSPQSVEQALKTRPEIKTVCITSPTYYGVLSDLPALAAV